MKIKKIIFGSFFTIGLGVLTNALWDGLKPLSKFLFEFVLSVSTLGVEGFKDSIYQDVAKGFHEGPSLTVFLFMESGMLWFIVFGSLSVLALRRKRFFLREKNASSKKIPLTGKKKGLLSSMDKIHAAFGVDSKLFVYLLLGMMLFGGTITTLDLVREKYVNNATTHFFQLLQIDRPFISIDQEAVYKSDFSQIKNKADYVELIDSLTGIAKNNDQNVPEFNFTF